jgi:hypothetical protein
MTRVYARPTTKRTEERHCQVLEFQIDAVAAHSVPRLVKLPEIHDSNRQYQAAAVQ